MSERILKVVIVTYKNRDMLAKCLSSVYDALVHSGVTSVVTVVDNNSSDGTRELVTCDHPKVSYIENEENFGLAKAINIGVRSPPDTPYTLIMNDDVVLYPDTVKRMLDVLEAHPEVMGTPANLFRPDGSLQRMKLSISGLNRGRRHRIRRVAFSGTTACLYRTAIFTSLGLFDEFYFFYNEDLDFAIRAKKKRVKFVFDPRAKVIHLKSQGRVKGEKSVKPHLFATDYYLYLKHYGPFAAYLYLFTARIRIRSMKRRLTRAGESEKLALVVQGEEKLWETVRRFARRSSKGASARDHPREGEDR